MADDLNEMLAQYGARPLVDDLLQRYGQHTNDRALDLSRQMIAGHRDLSPIGVAMGVMGPRIGGAPRSPIIGPQAASRLGPGYPVRLGKPALTTEEAVRLEALPGEKLPNYVDKVAEAYANGWPTAYHATPHTFQPEFPSHPLGRFDPSRVLSGEGHNAFGPGTGGYHAEAEPVALEYRRDLSVHKPAFTERVPQKARDVINDMFAHAYRGGDQDWHAFDLLKAHKRGDWHSPYPEINDAIARGIASGDITMAPEGGHMIESRLKAPLDRYLRYDLPLNQQSAAVQRGLTGGTLDAVRREAYNRAVSSTNKPRQDQLYGMVKDPTLASGEFVLSATPRKGWEAMAERFQNEGVHGVRYPDQFSRRSGGSRTFNYALWSPIAEILRRYAAPGAIGLGAAASQQDNRGQ